MSDTLRDRIAAAVSLHEAYAVTEQDEMCRMLPPSRWKCECGSEGQLPQFEQHKAEDAVWQTNAEHLADAILAIPGIAVVELDHTIKWLDDQAKHCTETAEDCEEEPEAHCKEMFYRGQAVGFGIASKRLAADAERDQDVTLNGCPDSSILNWGAHLATDYAERDQ